MSDADFDDDDLSNEYNDFDQRGSDEDTEDASETDMLKYEGEYTEIKEQMYQDKLASLKETMRQLENKTHPEYIKRAERARQALQDRIFLNDTDRIEKEYMNEKRAAVREFDERKSDLKESLLADLEEKKKMIEMERTSVEIMNEGYEPKPITTRKLRRRPNDPVPLPEKGRKRGPPTQLNQLLDDSEINDDLKHLNKAISKYARC